MSSQNTKPQSFERRRDFLAACARTTLGVSAVSLAPLSNGILNGADPFGTSRSKGKVKSVIYIFLTGGLSQIDSFDPKPGQ